MPKPGKGLHNFIRRGEHTQLNVFYLKIGVIKQIVVAKDIKKRTKFKNLQRS